MLLSQRSNSSELATSFYELILTGENCSQENILTTELLVIYQPYAAAAADDDHHQDATEHFHSQELQMKRFPITNVLRSCLDRIECACKTVPVVITHQIR